MIPIILKKSNVPSKAPTTADLDWGELAVNYTDGKLYYKKQSDNDPAGTIDYFTSSTAATGVNNGALTLASASGTTNTAVTINNGTGFTANSSQNVQYTIAVGPALTALSTIMAPNNTGLLKKTGTDTYTLDTTSYLTSAVTSVSGTGTVAGLSLSGTVTSTGDLTLSGTLSAPVTSINDSTTVGRNLVKLADPGAVTFLRVNADNTVSALNASDFRTAIGAGTGGGTGTVTSVSGTGTVAGLSLSGTVTTTGNLSLTGTLSAPVTSINDSTTVGRNLVKLTDPNSITFLRVNADNTVSALNASDFRTAIGAGNISGINVSAPITSTGGSTPTISIDPATTFTAGSMSAGDKIKLNGIEAGAQVNVPTNLAQGTRTSTVVLVTSSTGTTATLDSATTSFAGLMSAADKTKLDGIASGGGAVATNLAQGTRTATTVSITSSTGTPATLDLATTSLAGLMGAADKSKLNGIETGAQVNVATDLSQGNITSTTVRILSSTGTGVTLNSASTSLAGLMSAADKTKLDGITATNGITSVTATAPLASSGGTAPDISLSGGYGDIQNPYASKTANFVLASPNGTAGVPTFRSLVSADIPSLDASKITSGTISAARLPSYVDDVVEAANLANFPATGETGKIYVALDTNKTYRWSGSTYVLITSGAVDSVAGKTGVVTLTKTDVGLGNVDNTSDADKPVSTAQQIALNLKANIASPNFTGSVKENNNQVLHAGNYSQYSPTLTGGGASGSWSISVTGNANTATTLQTSRTINGVAFNGSQNIVVEDSTKLPLTGGTLTGSVTLNGGNIGVDVAPMSSSVTGRSIQIVNGGALLYGATGGFILASNITIDSSGNGVHQISAPASAYTQAAGEHIWYTSVTGTAESVANMVEGARLNSTALDSKVPIKENNNQVLHAGNYSNYAIPAVAPSTSGNVLTSNGSSWTSQALPNTSVNIQDFSTVGTSTWTKPTGAKMVHVVIHAGGAGGGSGRCRGGTAGSALGGGGGGAGGRSEFWIPASELNSTETVVVGAGGAGGAAQSVVNTNGNAGSTGNNSQFASFYARAGLGGAGGTSTTTAGGFSGPCIPTATYQSSTVYGTVGAGGTNAPTAGGRGGLSAGNGAGGAGFTTGSTFGNAGAAGGKGGAGLLDTTISFSGGGGDGGSIGGNGSPGAASTKAYLGGDGGGSGGSATAGGAPGNGGDGGFPGGGGGGGAAAQDRPSGAGGNGGNGFVRVTTFF